MKKVYFILVISAFFMFCKTISSYAAECRCGDEGVVLTVVSGCKDWNDATKCSGWASVAHANQKSETDLFPDKTQLSTFDCTIQINCPSGATPDGGSSSTEIKDEDESGWCSILNIE